MNNKKICRYFSTIDALAVKTATWLTKPACAG